MTKKVKLPSDNLNKKEIRPALTPEARENQLIYLATELAEKQLQNYENKGYEVNDNYELIKDGEPVLKVRKLTDEEIDLKVRHVSRVVKIGEFMDRYPSELSGGQQQRVATSIEPRC